MALSYRHSHPQGAAAWQFDSQSGEAYNYEFLTEKDIFLSIAKVVVFAVLVTLVHCYYGFTAEGGPEGVGRAAGRAIRASIVIIAFSDMLMTLLFWGTSSGVKVY